MGGQVGGQQGGKASGQFANMGQPAWASGATGNGAGATTPPTQPSSFQPSQLPAQQPQQPPIYQQPQASGSGNWWEPGSEAYNNMNTQLSTVPMGQLLNILQNGGQSNPAGNNALNAILNSGGTNPWMNEAADMFKQLGGPQGTANYQGVYDAAGQPGAAEKYLSQTAAGDLLKSNPYVDAIVQKGQDEAMTGINQMFAAGGRYGSGMNQGTVADSFQDVSNKFRGQEYENERNRQLQAAGAISGEQQGRLGLQNQAAGGVGGLQQGAASGLGGLGVSALGNWLAAIGQGNQGTQNQLAAMGQLQNVQNNKMFDSTVQQGVGSQIDQYSQSQLNDLINQWTQGDMQDWARLGGLMSAGTQTAGNWGTQSGTTKQSQSAGLGGILGGLLSIL